MSYLDKIDPNLVLLILTTLGGWVWSKVTGAKSINVKEALVGILRQEIARIVADPASHAKARECLNDAAWKGLDRVGVKKSKTLELIVNAAVETALGEVSERLLVLVLPERVAAMSNAAAGVLGAFVPPTNPTVPKIDASMFDVEIVKPD